MTRGLPGALGVGLLIAAVLWVAPGCKRPRGADARDTAQAHECTVALQPTGLRPVAKGVAEAEDRETATERSFVAACEGLPEAARGSCRDESQYKPVRVTAITVLDGQQTYQVTTQLQLASARHEQKASSSESLEAACLAARLAACEAAGAEGDCVAAGTHHPAR